MVEVPIGQLAPRLRMVPKELRRRLRPELVSAARPILADARSRASWSSRIPAATSVTVRWAGTRGGIYLRTSASVPYARAYEGVGGRGSFRHPVFGNRGAWVSQRTRPFLMPAALAGRPKLEEAAGSALDSALTRAGFG